MSKTTVYGCDACWEDQYTINLCCDHDAQEGFQDYCERCCAAHECVCPEDCDCHKTKEDAGSGPPSSDHAHDPARDRVELNR